MNFSTWVSSSENGRSNCTCLFGFLWELNKLIYLKRLEKYLAHIKHGKSSSYYCYYSSSTMPTISIMTFAFSWFSLQSVKLDNINSESEKLGSIVPLHPLTPCNLGRNHFAGWTFVHSFTKWAGWIRSVFLKLFDHDLH